MDVPICITLYSYPTNNGAILEHHLRPGQDHIDTIHILIDLVIQNDLDFHSRLGQLIECLVPLHKRMRLTHNHLDVSESVVRFFDCCDY